MQAKDPRTGLARGRPSGGRRLKLGELGRLGSHKRRGGQVRLRPRARDGAPKILGRGDGGRPRVGGRQEERCGAAEPHTQEEAEDAREPASPLPLRVRAERLPLELSLTQGVAEPLAISLAGSRPPRSQTIRPRSDGPECRSEALEGSRSSSTASTLALSSTNMSHLLRFKDDRDGRPSWGQEPA